MLTDARRLVLVILGLGAWSSPSAGQCLSWGTWLTSPPVDRDRAFYSPTWFDDGTGPALYLGTQAAFTGDSVVQLWNGIDVSPVGVLWGTAFALAEFDDGSGRRLYAGGSLYSAGTGYFALARWSGTAWEPIATGGSAPFISALVVHDDGSGPALFAGGRFRATPSSPDFELGRWDGTTWTEVGGGLDNSVQALSVVDEGQGPRLFVGGSFQTAGGQMIPHLARWDGVSYSAVGGVITNTVSWLDDYTDAAGQGLLAGGTFTGVAGQAAAGVALWVNGAWTVFPALPEGTNATRRVAAVDLGSGPRIHVVTGPTYPSTVRVRAWNGAAWEQVGESLRLMGCAGSTATYSSFLGALDFGAGPKLHVSGSHASVLGGISGRFAYLDGAGWRRVFPGAQGVEPSSEIHALASFDDGSGPALYVGGRFCRIDGATAIHCARKRAGDWDGYDFNEAPGAGLGAVVTAFGSYDLGSGPALFAGGHFEFFSPQDSEGVARWNGVTWDPLGPGLRGAGLAVNAICGATIGGTPRLFVGGRFTYAGWLPSPNIAAWDGTTWQALPPGPTAGVNGDVRALAPCDFGDGTRLYVGGSFVYSTGLAVLNRIARWDGSSFQPIGSGMNGDVYALCTFDDGTGTKLYAGGSFTTANGVPASRIACFDGSVWSPLGAGLDQLVQRLVVFDDGSGPALYAAGDFGSSGSTPLAHVARWNGAAWEPLGGGVGPVVRAMAVHREDPASPPMLWFGGNLGTASTLATSHLAAWRGCDGPITRFCFGDGTVGPCPCSNQGASGRGCNNSYGTLGARLNATGATMPDTIDLYVAGETPSGATLAFQGNALLSQPLAFGDGLRCVAGSLLRLYTANAAAGAVSFPSPADPSISARSAQLGDPLAPGDVRAYQTWYRDPDPSFCVAPATWNLSNAVRIVW